MRSSQDPSREDPHKSRAMSPEPASASREAAGSAPQTSLAAVLAQGPRMAAQRQAIRAAFGPAPQHSAIQLAALVTQLERTVTNRMKTNMQASLARVFGGPPSRYQIDQESGSTFPDGPPHYTTGHHGVSVTDTVDGTVYTCDFHQDGAYYTRG